jgi:serine phosphatase RsbU (regulator of sigma subunit)
VLGVIQVDTLDARRRFSRDDLDVLASVAGQAAMAIENAQLHERRLAEEVLRRELEFAHTVQRGLLPAEAPSLDGYEFCDFYEPARQLGGDYFDYIALPGGRLAMALGDVSGKGIAASLLMARLSADARYCLASLATPAEAIARLNDSFCQPRWEGRFVTFVVAVLDPSRHEICLVNAGHLSPLIRRASGEIEEIGPEFSGLPLGIDSGMEYQHHFVTLGPGDSLTLHTDGIPDAVNDAGEYYGTDRLKVQIGEFAPSPSSAGEPAGESLAQRVLRHVRAYIGSQDQTDDMCLTSMWRTK